LELSVEFSHDRLFRTEFVWKGKTEPKILSLEIQPQSERDQGPYFILTKLPSSSFRKLILAWLRHQTCFQHSIETHVSLPFSDCDTLVLLTRVSRVRMREKLEKVHTTLIFSVYWVSILNMVKTSNFPSHFILSRIKFQQLGQLPKPVTLKPLIVWGHINIRQKAENVIYIYISEIFWRFHLVWGQKLRFIRILKSAQHRNFNCPVDLKIS
jgi:hypothetical protein